MKPETPWLAADAVVFDDTGRLLLIRRKFPPFQGQFALPGGFVEIGETTEAAALRELKEETGLEGSSPLLIGVYSDPGRDPRRHVVSIVYLVQASSYEVRAGDDAAGCALCRELAAGGARVRPSAIIADALALKAKPC